MSTSLAKRWSKHLKTQGLDPAQARQQNLQQHVQRVRGAAASQAALLSAAAATAHAAQGRPRTTQPRPQSAPGQRRKNGSNRKKHKNQPPLPSPFSSFDNTTTPQDHGNNQPPVVGMRDFINNVRTLRRKNIVQHANQVSNSATQEKREAQLRTQHNEEMYTLKRSLTTLGRTNTDLIDQNKQLTRRLQTSTEETSSLSFNVTMLRKRLQLLTSREIENQRRLETFSRFAPLFDALDAYSSPADALRRLSVLEKEQSSNFADARQAEDILKKTTTQYGALQKTQESTIRELKVKLLEAQKHANIKIGQLEQDLHTAKQDARSLESFREKYLKTQTGVRNCYERALKAAAVLDVGDPRIAMASEHNVANVGHPLQMLEHLGLLFEASNPTKAAMRVHMLTGTINRMWLDLNEVGNHDRSTQSETKSKGNVAEGSLTSPERERAPNKLLFKPEDILKMVGKKILTVKIKEQNTHAKLETTQDRLHEVENECVLAEKSSIKMDLEIDRLRRLLKK